VRYHFSQLWNVQSVNDVRQTETQTAWPLAPQPSAFEVKKAIKKVRRHKSPAIEKISAEIM
jgi:hypothetical protein